MIAEKPDVRLAIRKAVDISKPRIGVFTTRNVNRHVSRCPGYEFEDLIVGDLGPAFFVEPRAEAAGRMRYRAERWFLRHAPHLAARAPGTPDAALEEGLDLFFAAPAVSRDLLLLPTIHGWRRRSARAICFLQELWVSEFEHQLSGVIGVLNQFDHVFCGLHHTAEALKKLLSVPVDYLPLGVDTDLFHPWRGQDKPRVIDACAIGNMDPATHAALWAWAERTGRYYHFSSVASANYAVSHREHRRNLAQTLQRTKVFFTYMAKRAVNGQRGAQEEFGPRYFEGAAAGAIQVGEAVKSNPAFLEHVGWEGAVIEAPYSFADMPGLLEEIGRNTTWVEAQRRANVSACLLLHDHLYRWDRVMAAAGLPETAGMAARRTRLGAIADVLTASRRTAIGSDAI